MSGNKNQHVVPYNDLWAVRGEGNFKVTSVHQTQAEAIEVIRFFCLFRFLCY